MNLYLASTSPRRQELLAELGVPFKVIRPRFEEKSTLRSAREEASYFAEQKALSVASDCPNAVIIGADTIVECNGKKFGKAHTKAEAREMLSQLSGKEHDVISSVVMLKTPEGSMLRHTAVAKVAMRRLTESEIESYIASGEPIGKAGAYALQAKGAQFVTVISGDRHTVIGLPLSPLRQWLKPGG